MRDLRGPAVFLVLAFLLTWGTAALVDAHPTTLLGASLAYAAVVGWPPLVAMWLAQRVAHDERALDRGRRPAPPRFSVLSIAAPLVLLAAAALVDGARAPAAIDVPPDLLAAITALCGVIAVLWLQAIAEELAWRGYLLPRLMRRLGGWPGLLVHGALWGVCYAPVFLVGDRSRIASFVVTCGLLGVLLGWLRLASRSIYASAASNATLTICAGLPLALHGARAPLGAVFEPIGWVPMLVAIALIAARSSLRAAIAVPERRIPEHVN